MPASQYAFTLGPVHWSLRDGVDDGLVAWSCAILVARDGDGGSRCADLLAIDLKQAPKSNQPLPFDLSRSYQLYRELFGQVEDLIKGKHLLIVPSGALT